MGLILHRKKSNTVQALGRRRSDGMRTVNKAQRIFYGLSLFKLDDGTIPESIHDTNIRKAFSITRSRMNGYLSEMRKHGILERIDREDRITTKGSEALAGTKAILNNSMIDPVKHNLSERTSLGRLLDRMRDPLEKIILLEIVSVNPSADLDVYLEACRMRDVEEIRKMTSEKYKALEGIDTSSLHDVISSRTFYGETNILKDDNPLVLAEISFEKGNINQAKDLFQRVLESSDLNRSEEIVARIGLIKIENLKGNFELVREMAVRLKDAANTSTQNAYIDMCYGWLLKENGHSDEGCSILKRCSRIFKRTGYTLLEGKCETYLGIHYFYDDRLLEARFHLDKAMKACKEGGHEYLRNYVKLNLHDVYLKEGDIEAADRMLSSAEKYFQELGLDLYGIAGCHFNRSLIQIERGDPVAALRSMYEAMNVAYPLPGPRLSLKWRDVFNARMREKGYSQRIPIGSNAMDGPESDH